MRREKAYKRVSVVSEEESDALIGLLDSQESEGGIDVTVFNRRMT